MNVASIVLAFATLHQPPPPHHHHHHRACDGGGEVRCFAHVVDDVAPDATGPSSGYVPSDLWSAYGIDPDQVVGTPTVAIVDAFGYANLESDLAQYRAQFGLPACTRANGCLRVVSQRGDARLPADPPANDDWTLETALDVEMASAACPRCRIVVVQADDDGLANLLEGQAEAVALAPTVISDSWGGPEVPQVASVEFVFDNPGLATFVASGDTGFESGGKGPQYPSTSAFVIAVGGTSLVRDGSSRGWSETAWSDAGTSCSGVIAKPSFQGSTGCARRATTDLSAVADVDTGLAIYNAANGGWRVVGGTSAATPIVASMFAATGHGDETAQDIATAAGQGAWNDVTAGGNGGCDGPLCNAGAGWDGPTGYGTPDAQVLAGGGGDTGMAGCSAGGGGGSSLALVMVVVGAVIGRRRRAAAAAAVAAIACAGCPGGDASDGAGVDGGRTGSGGDSGGGPSAPIATSALVFATAKASGGTQELASYDVVTKTVTPIAELGELTNSIALSPDRTAVAFTGIFRPEPAEVDAGYSADSLWVVTTGGAYARVTPPVLGLTPPGPDFELTMDTPAWSADESTLLFDDGQWWLDDSMLAGGERISAVDVSAGAVSLLPTGAEDCQLVGSPAVSPDGTRVAFARDLCATDGEAGVFVTDGKTVTTIAHQSFEIGQLAWTHDGHDLLQIASSGGIAVFAVPSPTAAALGTIPPPPSAGFVHAIAIDPTDRFIAACVGNGSGDGLYLMDASAKQPVWTEQVGLVTAGCAVSW